MDLNCLIMDNDSGYVSHNPESNLDSSNENLVNPQIKSPNKSFCLNEDTLLEKPRLQSINMCDSFDSLISASQESIKTNFSGFEESDQSDSSFIIPYSKPIVVKLTPASQKKDETIPTITKSIEDLGDCKTSSDKVAVTPQKSYENLQNSDASPDLFDDDDNDGDETARTNQSPVKRTPTEKYVDRNDLKLLKNVQSNLQGVYPPPSLTIIQLTVDEMLQKIKNNSNLFCVNTDLQQEEQVPSKVYQDWPEILSVRHHGLHHNRSRVSEEFELLCGKYGERYVGAETQSTCTVFETIFSPLKRKTIKSKWQTKSPGRRLSHLARRRITFSSANLQQTASTGSNNSNSCNNSLSILGSRTRQILVDVRKLGLVRKSPKKSPRKTPTKSPFKTKKVTPSNSAKKKLALKFRLMSGELENMASNSNHVTNDEAKRALFQPARSSLSISLPSMERKSTKRALFQSPSKTSPNKKSPFKSNFFERKRKRSESDENNPPKLMRSISNISLDLNQSSSLSSSSSSISASSTKPIMNRTFSDTTMSRFTTSKLEDLSDVHKKKLQWAVYEALRLQNISPTHPQFKIFASILARVTRRFLQNIAASRVECRTSERMLRIARFHSYAVVKGKSVDEIVNEYLRNKIKQQKPQGYIGIEEFQMKNILQDRSNIIENNKNDKASLPQLSQTKLRSFNDSRIDRIKKVITFEETS